MVSGIFVSNIWEVQFDWNRKLRESTIYTCAGSNQMELPTNILSIIPDPLVSTSRNREVYGTRNKNHVPRSWSHQVSLVALVMPRAGCTMHAMWDRTIT